MYEQTPARNGKLMNAQKYEKSSHRQMHRAAPIY